MQGLAAREEAIPSLYVKTFESHYGHEQSIREIFTKARRTAPCLLIFEDIDSLVHEAVRSYFLNEVDGLEDNDGILIVATTNHRKSFLHPWRSSKALSSSSR
jgi:AAA+ superfamily predicted ATPase